MKLAVVTAEKSLREYQSRILWTRIEGIPGLGSVKPEAVTARGHFADEPYEDQDIRQGTGHEGSFKLGQDPLKTRRSQGVSSTLTRVRGACGGTPTQGRVHANKSAGRRELGELKVQSTAHRHTLVLTRGVQQRH